MSYIFSDNKAWTDWVFEELKEVEKYLQKQKPTQVTNNKSQPNIRFNPTDTEHCVEIDLPGVQKKDCVVEVLEDNVNGLTTISVNATRIITRDGVSSETKTSHSFSLFHADFNNVEASLDNGVLTIKAPKVDHKPNKRILLLSDK
jgi:HSP20 family molecular chaperone IbpA